MIVFVHLNNDFSGSPKVLRDVIEVAEEISIPYKLYVSNSSDYGFLSNSARKVSLFWYKRFGKNRLLTFLLLSISQMHLLVKLLLDKEITSDSVIYVNALLPFGANLYALLTGRKLICHIHEVSVTPYLFYRSLVTLNRYSSDLNIFVSDEHYKIAGVRRVKSIIVPNSVDTHFLRNGQTHPYVHKVDGEFVILMICGAARYKGIPEFFEMARETVALNFNISFKLVINCPPDEIQSYTDNNRIPPNVTVSSVTDDVTSYYRSASVLVNLSRPDMWVETFGLTILEAMAFGLPVIAPPVGGPVNIVSDNVDGFLIDSRDVKKVVNSIVDLYLNPTKHRNMSCAAKLKAKDYSYNNFKKLLIPIINP